MGINLRIFLVNDDDTLKRLPLAKYERLHRGDPTECLLQYADRRVRYALVAVEMENRKPVGINRIQYSYLPLDSEGRIDAVERERGARLAMEMLPPISSEEKSQQVIDAQHKFAKKKYDAQFIWEPSPKLEASIVKEIFEYDKNEML